MGLREGVFLCAPTYAGMAPLGPMHTPESVEGEGPCQKSPKRSAARAGVSPDQLGKLSQLKRSFEKLIEDDSQQKDFEEVAATTVLPPGAGSSSDFTDSLQPELVVDDEQGQAASELAVVPVPAAHPDARLTGRSSAKRIKPAKSFIGERCRICSMPITDEDGKDYGSIAYACIRHITCHNAMKRMDYNACSEAEQVALKSLKKNKEAFRLKIIELKHSQGAAGAQQKDLVIKLLERFVAQTRLTLQIGVVMLDFDGYIAFQKYKRNKTDEVATQMWHAAIANKDSRTETVNGVIYLATAQAKSMMLERSVALERALELPEQRTSFLIGSTAVLKSF